MVHTHSPEATSWAQAGRDIPLYGTTHADYFFGPIPCARSLTPEEIDEAYETNTGKVIIETFETRGIPHHKFFTAVHNKHSHRACGRNAYRGYNPVPAAPTD